MEYVVAIPSLSRPCALKRKTLQLLDEHNIPKNSIYVFVIENEYEIYKSIIGDEYNLVCGVCGIAAQRNFISQYFEFDTYICSFDDDIEKVMFLDDDIDLTIVNNLKLIINFMINTMDSGQINLAGIYPIANAFYMRDTVTTDLRFCIGGFYIFKNKKLMLSTSAESKEDIENTIKYFIHDGSVLRFNNLTFKSKKHACGGLGKDRNMMNAYAASYLVNTYPSVCVYRKNSVTEVRLKRNIKLNLQI